MAALVPPLILYIMNTNNGGFNWLGAAQSVGSLASGIFSGIGANKRQKQAIKAQKEENAAARQWSEKMYNKQTSDERFNVANERAYNTPSAISSRLQAAGLNKDLMYGSGAGSLVDANVAGTGSVGNVAPADVGSMIMNTPTMADSILKGISAMREVAETRKINAETDKTTGEITSLDLDNAVKAATQGAKIENENLTVQLSRSYLSLNDAQRSKLIQELNNLQSANELCNAKIVETYANVKGIDQATISRRIETAIATGQFDLAVRDLQQKLKESDSRIDLNRASTSRILALTLSEKLNIDADTLLKKIGFQRGQVGFENDVYQQDILKIQGRQMEFNYQQGKKYDDVERTVNIATKVAEVIPSFLGNLIKAPKIGFK